MGIKLNRHGIPSLPGSEVFYPFQDIAVSLSGGGFRSAAYSLGCLSYLQRRKYENTPLLEHVKFITSSSGGSLTGILFSAYNHKGIPFSQVYERLHNEILVEDKILREALKVISDDTQWPEDSLKTRNTINAFAKTYQKLVFDDMKFGVYWDKSKATIEEVCFNASELKNGRTFRFETDGKADAPEMVGDPYLHIRGKDMPVAEQLLLGDIMAASACAPIGFEPMVFPDDFAQDELHRKVLADSLISAKNHDRKHYEHLSRPFTLMDGGITDNQGIGGLKLANKKRRNKNGRGFDLTLICDVANNFLEPLEPLKEVKNWWNKISAHHIIYAHKYSSIVLFLSLIMICTSTLSHLGWALATVSGLMFGIFLITRYAISKNHWLAMTTNKNIKTRNLESVNTSMFLLPFNTFLDFFLESPLSRTGMMFKARIDSTMRVARDIYMLQIRRINYENLSTDPEWFYKIKVASIYELSKSNTPILEGRFISKGFDDKIIAELTPSEKIMNVAEYARKMGTTLWFSVQDLTKDKSALNALIACGQFTMCFNLLEYVFQLENEFDAVRSDLSIQLLKKDLLRDWKLFQAHPECMVADYEIDN